MAGSWTRSVVMPFMHPANTALKSPQSELLDKSILFCLVKLFFSSGSIFFLINRWLQLSLLYIPSTGLLGLGSKVYPSNMQRMLNKGFTRVKHSLSRVRQNWASKRKSLLAGWCSRRLICYFVYELTIQASKEWAAEVIILSTRQKNRNGLNIYTPRTTRKNRIREYKVWRAACNEEHLRIIKLTVQENLTNFLNCVFLDNIHTHDGRHFFFRSPPPLPLRISVIFPS